LHSGNILFVSQPVQQLSPESFRDFSQPMQERSGELPEIKQRSLPSKKVSSSCATLILLFEVTQRELLIALLRK
jgi:hypothetical protein